MKETLENVPRIEVNGQNVNNLRYSDIYISHSHNHSMKLEKCRLQYWNATPNSNKILYNTTKNKTEI